MSTKPSPAPAARRGTSNSGFDEATGFGVAQQLADFKRLPSKVEGAQHALQTRRLTALARAEQLSDGVDRAAPGCAVRLRRELATIVAEIDLIDDALSLTRRTG